MELFFVELPSVDWRRTAAWYATILGLRETLRDEAGGFVLLEGGGGRIALKHSADSKAGGVRLIFRVVDLEGERARLVGLGQAVFEPREDVEGYREVRLSDPEGRSVRLFSWSAVP